MSFAVTCRGTAKRAHSLRTVAQFRNDDGWARVHTSERDDLLWEPWGELRTRHRITCPICGRDEVLRPETLYPLLDWARDNGKTEVPLN